MVLQLEENPKFISQDTIIDTIWGCKVQEDSNRTVQIGLTHWQTARNKNKGVGIDCRTYFAFNVYNSSFLNYFVYKKWKHYSPKSVVMID